MIDRMVDVAHQNGLVFDFDIAKPANTFDAHRLLHLALDRGVQQELKERLLAATFAEGAPIGDSGVLAKLAVAGGLDFDEVRAVLDGDAYSAKIRADERRAAMLASRAFPSSLSTTATAWRARSRPMFSYAGWKTLGLRPSRVRNSLKRQTFWAVGTTPAPSSGDALGRPVWKIRTFRPLVTQPPGQPVLLPLQQ